MTANELRIGNFLYNDKVVVKIDARSIFDIWDDKGLKKYEPIPITEQWILKFGFEKDISITTRNIYCNGGFAIIQTISGNNYFYEGIELKFVHLLQNLYFAITQKELEL